MLKGNWVKADISVILPVFPIKKLRMTLDGFFCFQFLACELLHYILPHNCLKATIEHSGDEKQMIFITKNNLLD